MNNTNVKNFNEALAWATSYKKETSLESSSNLNIGVIIFIIFVFGFFTWWFLSFFFLESQKNEEDKESSDTEVEEIKDN